MLDLSIGVLISERSSDLLVGGLALETSSELLAEILNPARSLVTVATVAFKDDSVMGLESMSEVER